MAVEIGAPPVAKVDDDATQARLDDVYARLGLILTELQTGDTVNLSPDTLAALEAVSATVSNFPSHYPLTDAQVADLKSVAVTNQRTDYPLPTAQFADVAKDATVGATRDRVAEVRDRVGLVTGQTVASLLDAVRTQTANVESLLTVLRDNQLRRTDPLPAGSNALGTVSVTGTVATDEVDQDYGLAVKEGRAFFAGGKQNASAGGNADFVLANPALSGRDVNIFAFGVSCNENADAVYLNDPTVGGAPTVCGPHHSNQYFDGVAAYDPVATLRKGANILTGGLMSPVSRLGANRPGDPYRFPFVIPPGQSFGLRATSGLTEINLYVTVFWYETTAAA